MPNKYRLSAGAIIPRDMNQRQFGEWARAQSTPDMRNGQTGYDTGTGFFLGDDDGTPKFSVGDSTGNKVTWDGTTLSITGNVVLGTGNFLRSGQTAYDTGTGWWIGNDSGTPKLSIGDSAGNKLTWDGSELSITGSANLTNTAQSWQPTTYTGFSSNPSSANFSYIDFGAYVLLWKDIQTLGTSDANTFTFGTLPSAIRPSNAREVLSTAIDNTSNLVSASARINTTGDITMKILSSGVYDASGWTPSGTKGFPVGMMLVYPK